MIKKSILLLSALACFTGSVNAQQRCAADEVYNDMVKQYPQIATYQDLLNKEFKAEIARKYFSNTAALTQYPYTPTADSVRPTRYIPIVVHIVHDYGTEYISDNDIYQWIDNMNVTYRKENSELSNVIAPFVPYIGNPKIQFRLATKDPMGNATKGITRYHSYLTKGGDDQAKFDLWAPNRYLNIWLIRFIGRGISAGVVAAYSTFPASAAAQPYTDGIIGGSTFLFSNKTYEHEIGHYLNLLHPWSNNNKGVSQECGDDDVDDTPPTTGHFGSGRAGHPESGGNCNSDVVLYDTTCATGYQKTYGAGSAAVTADFPDTTNVQNIMDYAECPSMFTHMQVDRMEAALRSTVGNRSNLATLSNLVATGVMDASQNFVARPDLKPVPDYSVEKVAGVSQERSYFLCANDTLLFNFKDRSWRDTIPTNSIEWTFSGTTTPSTATTSNNGSISVKTQTPGWMTVTLKATGNNSGDSTITRTNVYAADPNYKIDVKTGIAYQEFNKEGNDIEKWPIFNYYNNDFKWELADRGYYDNTSIVYRGFDARTYPGFFNGAAGSVSIDGQTVTSLSKDVDDFFTPAFDLSDISGDCNLNFMYSGAYRSADAGLIKDSLEISYSTNCGSSWTPMAHLTKGNLVNKGTYSNRYAPQYEGDWDLKSLNIPTAARTGRVYFRFRYKPSIDINTSVNLALGNDYYIDRINVSTFPLGVNTLVKGNTIAVTPNPTTANAFVVVKTNTTGAAANVVVTDITGKVVYKTQQVLNNAVNSIEIPAESIQVKGIYIVQVVMGNQVQTEKLVVR